MKNTPYYHQATLLLRILPLIYRQKEFALKGGTAINFFVRDFPRLSVDIDLVYLPIQDRTTTFTKISNLLKDLDGKMQQTIPGSKVIQHIKDGYCTKLTVRTTNATIKIEPNYTIRGTVYPVIDRIMTPAAGKMFEIYVKCQTLSDPDLYGGKICAALDRQHPRDLFDVKLLLENGGITEEIKNAFIFYLLSHHRPIVDVLNPNPQDIEESFEKEFKGMTSMSVELNDLIEARTKLIEQVNNMLNEKDRRFILSFKYGKPEWDLYAIPDVKDYPSIIWKLKNISRMDKEKRKNACHKLEQFLF